MSELPGIDSVGLKNQMSKVSSSKPKVSVEATPNAHKVEGAQELKEIEIEMEAAGHAFALMTDIREKIEKAYNELSSPAE